MTATTATAVATASAAAMPPGLATAPAGRPAAAAFLVARTTFVLGERLIEPILQLEQRIGPHGAALPPRHHEAERSIEHRQLFHHQRARDLLRKPQSHHGQQAPVVLLDIVLEPHGAVTDFDGVRQVGRRFALRVGDEITPIEEQRHRPNRLPIRGGAHSLLVPRRELGLPQSRGGAAETAVHLAHFIHDGLVAPHGRMSQLAARGCFRQQMPRAGRELGREDRQRFSFP